METLIECVPNFSEGRNPETIRALVAAIRAIPDVFLIDEEMDQDHHRSVLTFVGAPDAVAEAAFQVTRVATDLIDLRGHQGGHPRVGATDVVPFVPIRGTSMEDCVELARKVGERIGRELQISVFLYERAAPHPDRSKLEVIRKGGLEGLAGRMEIETSWAPDFGPPRLHPTAGAIVVGARPPLIAYNVNLQSDDLTVAKAIAKTIRFSSGGLPSLKAIGVDLTSRRLVQVSMNLTNFEETPIHVAFEAVSREAASRGITVAGSEIIGLVPERALMQVAEHSLKLEHFDPTQVLETRLELVLARESNAQDQQHERTTASGAEGARPPGAERVSAGLVPQGKGPVSAGLGREGAIAGGTAPGVGGWTREGARPPGREPVSAGSGWAGETVPGVGGWTREGARLGAPGVGGCNERLDASVAAFLEAVSAGTPTPGGGSVAALAGALAAALGIMACRIGPPTGPDKPAHTATQLHATEQRLLSLRFKLQALIQSDADAYANVMNAYRMPKDDSSRAAAIVKHLEAATEVPLETATLAAEAATVLRELLPLTKPSVASDLKVGLLMALAAIEGGLENVKTNLKSIKKPDLINKYRAQLAAIEESLVQLRRVC